MLLSFPQKKLFAQDNSFLQKLCIIMAFMCYCTHVQGHQFTATKKHRKLEAELTLIEDRYKDVFAAYEKFKVATPPEFEYHYDHLKKALVKAVESTVPSSYTSSREDFRSSNPLFRFVTSIIPQHIKRFKENRLNLPESELTKKADTYIALLQEIRNVVSALCNGPY